MDERKALKEGQIRPKSWILSAGHLNHAGVPQSGGGGNAELVGFQTAAGPQGSNGRADSSNWLTSRTEKIAQSEPWEAKITSITLSRYSMWPQKGLHKINEEYNSKQRILES